MTPQGNGQGSLSARGISKRFGPVHALSEVDLDVPAGEVTALMGENGAGKSTLLKILSGDYQPDDGLLMLGGEEVRFSGPLAARAAGIRVISQEPEIVPYVNVAENMFVGSLPARHGLFSQRGILAAARRQLERFGFEDLLDPETLGAHLSPAQRQLVEIVRALADDPQVICFDEPTSSLADAETDTLFRLIARLREEGRAIAYVSHRMKEIFRIADSVTVLRDGQLVGSRPVGEVTEAELVRMMVGRDLSAVYKRERGETGDIALELDSVTTQDVRDISFNVRHGEVVAVAGLVGAGRTELALAIAGDRPIQSGVLKVKGKPVVLRSPADAIRQGIGLAPEERKSDALIMMRSVRDNISVAVLDRLSRFGIVNRHEERDLARTYMDNLRIRTPSPEQLVQNLSGGNQQKVVLARWLARETDVLVLDEPTRGVDVGAKAEIYTIINQLTSRGVAVLVISSELPEVLGLADRIVVMHRGRLAGELDRDEATEEKILALAMDPSLEGAGT